MSEAFEALVARQATPLLRTAYLLTGDRAQARDLLHTALIATYRHGNTLADPATHARQQLVRAATGWTRRLRFGDLLGESPLLAGASGLPGFGTPNRAEPGPRTELTAALAQLPARQRAAVVLRHGEGLSEADTAEALDTSADDVVGLLAAALIGLDRALPGSVDVERLRTELAVRAAEVAAGPDDTLAAVLDGARSQHGHRVGLAVLVAFVVLVVLLVALTV